MTSPSARRVMALRETMSEKLATATVDGMKVEVLQESFNAVVSDLMRFEGDDEWISITGGLQAEEKGFSLADLRRLIPYAEKQTKILGDLLGRGLRLKNNHVFGRGFSFERGEGDLKVQPRFQAIIDDPDNREAVFSPTAMKALNRIFFTAGNLIVRYDKSEKKFSKLSIDLNVENYISDERDQSKLKYILHVWEERNDLSTERTNTKREWVPVSTYTRPRGGFPATIKVGNEDVPVARNSVVIVQRINRDNGDVWGVPDCFSAIAPAVVYADYVKSGAKLQHALAAISFVVKAKTQAAAKAAGAKLQNGRVGSAAITGPETEIQSMPRAGQVNLYEGRPLAARVASALDVSVTGITSDTGTGGSYASENALSAPEQMSALSRQEDFSNFFAEVFRVMGAEDLVVNFARTDSDPIHRSMQSLGLARTLGGISQAEYRARSLELLDVKALSDKLPEPDEFTGSKASTLASDLNDDPDADNRASSDPIASQGNSGAVGSLDDSNSARDSDRDAGVA